jgi:hypothetical protein
MTQDDKRNVITAVTVVFFALVIFNWPPIADWLAAILHRVWSPDSSSVP